MVGFRLFIVFNGTLLSALLLPCCCIYQKGEHFPVYTTQSCPKNPSEWSKRSSAINCTRTNGYMCLPNDKFTGLEEFCYTLPRIAITKGLCLYLYNKTRINAYKCQQFTDGCPDKFHFSDTVYKYQSCLKVGNGCFSADPSCIRREIPLYTSSTATPANHTLSNGITEKASMGLLFWVIIIIVSLWAVVYLVPIGITSYCSGKKSDTSNIVDIKEDPAQLESFVNGTAGPGVKTSNTGPKKTNHYKHNKLFIHKYYI